MAEKEKGVVVPRLILGGTHKGVGKSTVALGLALGFRRRKVAVTWCVRSFSPRALVLQRYSGRAVQVLDRAILSCEQIVALLILAAGSSDLVIIDGEEGVYDGLEPLSLVGSDAELAARTDTPLMLVADGSRADLRLPPLIAGHQHLATGFSFAGTLINRIAPKESGTLSDSEAESARGPSPELSDPSDGVFEGEAGEHGADALFHEAAAQIFGLPPPVGFLRSLVSSPLPDAPAGSYEAGSQVIAHEALAELEAGFVGDNLTEKLLAIGTTAPPLDASFALPSIPVRNVPIAFTFDSCFGFGVADNLTLIRHYGGIVRHVSPLVDSTLPSGIGGLYVGGCYLTEYLEDIANNRSFGAAVRDFVTRGGVLYAEGSGTAYLAEKWRIGDLEGEGLGIIPGVVTMLQQSNGSLDPLAPATFVTEELSILGNQGTKVKGYWRANIPVSFEPRLFAPFTVVTRYGLPLPDGYAPHPQVVATTGYLHWGSNPEVARIFVESCRASLGLRHPSITRE